MDDREKATVLPPDEATVPPPDVATVPPTDVATVPPPDLATIPPLPTPAKTFELKIVKVRYFLLSEMHFLYI